MATMICLDWILSVKLLSIKHKRFNEQKFIALDDGLILALILLNK
jgi:hypothetical protein